MDPNRPRKPLALAKKHKADPDPDLVDSFCPFCSSLFPTMSDRNAHMKNDHSDILAYQCHLCNEISIGKDELKSHQMSHRFRCGVCYLEFLTKNELVRHGTVHIERIYSCEHCDAQFTRKEAVLEHKRISHPVTVNLPLTMKVPITVVRNRFNHVLPVGETRVSQPLPATGKRVGQPLQVCGKRGTSISGWSETTQVQAQAMLTNMKTGEPMTSRALNVKSQCTSGFQLFPSINKLAEHVQREHKRRNTIEKPFACIRCKAKFLLEGSLRRHECSSLKETSADRSYFPRAKGETIFLVA